MDTSDPLIEFDGEGICRYCRVYERNLQLHVHTGDEGRRRLEEIAAAIRKAGEGKDYDCVIGVSGGVDSTFTAYAVRQWGLRPLAVHLDNGWDSEIAVSNINKALTALKIDLHTHVIDWEEFRDLQLAFLKASTPDSEIPTDHAIVALMYRTAWRIGVRYVITGYNYRTESHLSPAWSQGYYDWRYIKSVHRRFGRLPLKTFPYLTWWSYRRSLRNLTTVDILNYLDYRKGEAIGVLEKELGWRYYGGKHYESIYTRFYQGYLLPRKFGYDKRRAHLSSLICAGETTRQAALAELEQEPYPADLQAEDKVYVSKKLGLTDAEFEAIIALPKRTFWDYPSYGRLYRHPLVRRAQELYHRLRG
jgi:N-acetyl sugar amidotransferase